jgi:cell division protein FtsW (lipid II flippase)
MGVTISRAAERRSRPPPGSRLRGSPAPPGLPGEGQRLREAGLLALAAAVVLFAMVLIWFAVQPSPELRARLDRGEIVNLNAVARPGDLLPLLSFLGTPAERAYAAGRIQQRLAEGRVDNVGELGRLRVPAKEVDPARLPDLAARLAGSGRDSVALLSGAELRQLKPRLVVRTPAEFRRSFLLGAALLFGGFLLVHLVLRFRRFGGDELLLPALLLLCGLGFVLMASLRDPLRDLPLQARFALGVAAGCLLFLAGALVDVERTPLPRRSAWALAAAAFLSGLLILFGGGPGGSDAKVNFFGFQPVELIKILIALFLAGYFADRWELLREVPERRLALGFAGRRLALPRLEYALPPLVAIGLVVFFFFLQKDLGPALVLASLFLLLFSVARGRAGMALCGIALVALAFFAGYELGYPKTVHQRIGMWMAPWDTWFRGGDHLAQAIWSLSAGGATGTGLGLGDPGLVPEAHTDMILSAVGEEMGFLGLLAVAALYALLVQRGLRAARRAGSAYGFFLALGLTLLLALETALIGGGVLGLLPLSGVASPFLSFGRSAMLANFLIAGVLAGISSRRPSASSKAAVRPFLGSARWVGWGLGLFLLLALARLADLQLVRPDRYLTRGAVTLQGDGVRRFQYNPRLASIAATIPRGSILDRNGLPLATSDPGELAAHHDELAGLGGTDLDAATPDRRTRVYPFGGRTFHLLGDLRNRVNWGAKNTSFVERDARVRLQGYDDYAGVVRVRQPDGTETPQVVVDYRELVPLLRHRYQPQHAEVRRILGRDRTVRLTVDVRLQLAAEEILKKYAAQVGEAGAGAAAVALDAESGDLLAAASYPFPERLPVEPAPAEPSPPRAASKPGASGAPAERTVGPLVDRARYGIYPPGSTFKIVTALAALRKDPGLAARTYDCKALSEGRVGNRVRGRAVRDDPTDAVPHGTLALDKGIRVSCNAYFAQLGALAVGPVPLFETAKLLGISVARPNTPQQLDKLLPQASYGQGQVVATPFQMARVAATVAAGGRMPEGRWIQGEDNPRSGVPVAVLDAAATGIVARAMRGVVTGGTATAYLSRVEPPIAGKTGTAEVQDQRSHSWFIGFAPFGGTARRIAVAVIVEHGGYGGRLAAPAAGEIVRRAAALGLLRENGTGGTAP